jgi:hypothetical protein
MRFPLRFTFFFLLLILTSCTLPTTGQSVPPTLVLVTPNLNASPTPTPFQPGDSNYIPVNAPTLVSTFTPLPPTDTPLPTLEFTATTLPQPTPPPQTARTQYTLYALFDYFGNELAVDETVAYTNQTGVSLNEIVMAVEPMHRGGFTLEHILLEGNPLTYDINGHRLTVNLPQALQPNEQLTLAMRFRIDIPAKLKGHPYGYTYNQTNLTDWYLFIVPYINGWVLHDEYHLGEHLIYDAADYEVNVKLTEGDVVIAASGVEEPNGEWSRYRLYGARTFALSASDRFKVVDSSVGSAAMRAYYFPGYEDEGVAVLNAMVRSVGLFESLFGPYPYGSLSVVQTDLNDGQEYDGLVFTGSKFFDEYGGSARSNLVAISVHEIAHQWWFGLVGNDQALEPWLDEALSIYSEALFYKHIYPNSLDWWWQFRVNYFGPSGYVDSSIYEAPTFRAYVNASYLNGANFLEVLNYRMGDDAFYAFLKDYASRYGRGHATAYDFFAVARQNTTADISDLVAAYFRSSY